MTSVLLRLEGPLQSWGIASRFTERDTGAEPSKSGVLGLVCAAMGIDRSDDATLTQLVRLQMAVRVDREGLPSRDYQTAGGGRWPGREYGVYKAQGGKAMDTVLSNRHFLADASFLVALGSDDAQLVGRIDAALGAPRWPLFLGRRAHVPSRPIKVAGGVVPLDPRQAVRVADLPPGPVKLRLVVDCAPGEGRASQDVPVSFRSDARRFALRYTRVEWLEIPQTGT